MPPSYYDLIITFSYILNKGKLKDPKKKRQPESLLEIFKNYQYAGVGEEHLQRFQY